MVNLYNYHSCMFLYIFILIIHGLIHGFSPIHGFNPIHAISIVHTSGVHQTTVIGTCQTVYINARVVPDRFISYLSDKTLLLAF